MPFSIPVAVVDIGSNSVRLVIYDGLKRSPMPLFNEKILCGLARGIEKTGMLYPEGVKKANTAIRRFVKLSEVMKVRNLHLFATSAVRDARDGKDFVANIEKKYGISVSIFSEEEEAKYAGMGVIASISNAKGVVGDLGGGSLELIEVGKEKVDKGVSYPIGPLRINKIENNKDKLQDFIEKHIGKFPLDEVLSGKSFYAVGGAFRNLAKVHMGRKNYPLKVIHNYKVSIEDFAATIQIVSRMSEESLMRIPGIPKKRLNFLPYAALILDRIIKIGKPKNIVFTATGVREGFLFAQLSELDRLQDPLICGCIEMMSRILRPPEYGYELAKWMSPLFSDNSEQESKLLLASCIMSEISCYENTEYRAELAYRKVLDSSLTGLSHKDRVFIAKSLYCRYSTYPDEHILSTMQSLLGTSKALKAQMIGSAMRLGRSLSCSNSGVLDKTSLEILKKKLVLKLNKDLRDIDGEVIKKRVWQLAEVMGLEATIES